MEGIGYQGEVGGKLFVLGLGLWVDDEGPLFGRIQDIITELLA